MHQAWKNAGVFMATACAVLSMCTLSGCKDSDALKEIIWNQLSGIVDYDDENKYIISDENAEQTSEDLAADETSKDATSASKTQNLVVYSSEPNNEKGYLAKQSLWSSNPDFEGLEASSKVSFYRSNKKSATEQDIEDDEPEEKQKEKKEKVATGGNGSGSGSGSGDKASKNSKNKKNQEAEDGGGAGKNGQEEEGADADDPEGNISDEGDLTGDYVDPPKVGSIAAYGDAAVLVQMMGGKGALAAADSTLLSGKFKDVFDDEGVSKIKKAWSGNGSAEGSIDVDAIIASGAEAVLVYSGDYLSNSEFSKLEKAGVEVCKIRPMYNTTYVKKDAELIGDMLAESEALDDGWDSVAMAEEYTDYFNDLIKEVAKEANGNEMKLAGSKVFELKNSNERKYSFNNNAKATLLLDGFDTSARYTADIDGWQPVSNGAAFATIGWAKSATSFYIQVGGLVNNASAKSASTSTGQVVAWQFRQDSAKASKSKWSYSSGGLMDKSANLKGTDGWDMCLFTTKFSSDFSQADFTMDSTFGSSEFPVIIATTRQIKEKVIENSAKANGIYHPYSSQSTWLGSIFGKYTPGGTMVQSTIGVDTSVSTKENMFSDGSIPSSAIAVNPCGLFSSWTGGASPESVLEAAWVNDVVNADSGTVGWKDKVKEFYEKFYRYTVTSSDMNTIEAGKAS